MIDKKANAGYLRCGMPYHRLGHGPRPLVVFLGLSFENKPPPALMLSMYTPLEKDFSIYSVTRRPGLPRGYSLKDMADDYAEMIREEFGGPVDVIGVSTGGSIVQHFAADHPDLVRRLVIHSSAYTLSDESRCLQLQVACLAKQSRWTKAYETLIAPGFSHTGMSRYFSKIIIWLVSRLMAVKPPKDANDLVVTVEAEDKFDFKDQLARIEAPTLVVAGTNDPFYNVTLFRKTAEGIPHARLILYEGMGHPAGGKRFGRDVLAFLKETAPA